MKYLFIILFGLFIANVSFAEDTTVEMLNKLDKRTMVFSQEIVRIDPGDTVFWKATNPGHNVQFISKNGVPAGVEKFKSKAQDITRIVNETAVELGGSYSGEHGIGLVLKEDFIYFSDPIKIQLMETIKRSIDPKNIMNPNKLIG